MKARAPLRERTFTERGRDERDPERLEIEAVRRRSGAHGGTDDFMCLSQPGRYRLMRGDVTMQFKNAGAAELAPRYLTQGENNHAT